MKIIKSKLFSKSCNIIASLGAMLFLIACDSGSVTIDEIVESSQGNQVESSDRGQSSSSNKGEHNEPDVSSSDTVSDAKSSSDETGSSEINKSSEDTQEDSSEDKTGDGSSYEISIGGGDSDYILGDDVELRTYNIIIDPDSLDKINAVPQDEIYVMAHLVFEGDTIQDVQIRYKGSTGAWYPCTNDAETGSPWPPGPNQCAKLSTKIKFNTPWAEDRKFYGLKKLQFHHMHHYDSQLRERVIYWMHRAMGNPAPRAVHARVEINGELSGLYTMVEQIDGRFTRARWDDGEGNIYKNNAPLKDGAFSDDATLMEHLKTNEDEDPVFTQWQTFEEELDAADDVDAIKGVIEKWFEVPLLVSTVITSISLGHWDSPYLRTKYEHHNSYWYSDTTEQKLYSLPWDVDNALISIGGFPGEMGKDHMKSNDVLDALQCNSPVPNKFSAHWLCFPEDVKPALDKLLDEVYPEIFPLIDEWKAQIEGITLEAFETHGGDYPRGALTVDEWEKGVENLKNALEDGKSHVENWRDAL